MRGLSVVELTRRYNCAADIMLHICTSQFLEDLYRSLGVFSPGRYQKLDGAALDVA